MVVVFRIGYNSIRVEFCNIKNTTDFLGWKDIAREESRAVSQVTVSKVSKYLRYGGPYALS